MKQRLRLFLIAWIQLFESIVGIITFGFYMPQWVMSYMTWELLYKWGKQQKENEKLAEKKIKNYVGEYRNVRKNKTQ